MDDVNVLNEFQSTLSVRRATHRQRATIVDYGISIHALRKESDAHRAQPAHFKIISIHALRKESDNNKRKRRHDERISIHALRKESDLKHR